MSRTLGTVVRGVRAPIFREGDNVVQITTDTVLNALKDNGITARDGDIVAITESVVARCQGNYATVEQIAASAAHTGRPRRRWEERTAADSTTGRASHTARPACFLFLPTPSQPRRTRCRAACALLDHIAALRIGSPWEDLSAAPMRTPPTR